MNEIKSVMEWMVKKAAGRPHFTGLKPRKYHVRSGVYYTINGDGSKMPNILGSRK